MLKQTQKELPYIGIFKVMTGEEFVAKVLDDNMFGYTIEKPLCLVATERGTQFAPFMMMNDPDKAIALNKSAVVATSVPQGKLRDMYEEITSPIARVAPGTTL